MKQKSIFLFAVVLLFILSFSGCSFFTEAKQLDAVDAAITGYEKYPIQVDDLRGQIAEQLKSNQDAEDSFICTVMVQLPALSSADVDSVSYDIPAYDLNEPDAGIFREDFHKAFVKGVAPYFAEERESWTYVDVPVDIQLVDADGEWTADSL